MSFATNDSATKQSAGVAITAEEIAGKAEAAAAALREHLPVTPLVRFDAMS